MATAINEETYGGFHRGRSDLDRLRANRYGQLEILVPTLARDLHVASAADAETDWNVANPTHPTVYIHSETTPATDYLRLSHDGTNGYVDTVGGSLALQVAGTTVLTLAAALVTLAQDVVISSGFGLNVGSATQATISDGDGATNLIPEGQFHGVGTAFAGGSVLIATYNTTNDRTVSPKLAFLKGAAATQVATTAVADNEVVGSIIAYGSDSGDFETPVAAIEFVVDDVGGPGASAIGGSLVLYTTADGGSTLTLAMTISAAQRVLIPNGQLIMGAATTSGALGANTITPIIAAESVANQASSIALGNWGADASIPRFFFKKSRSGVIGTPGIVASGEGVGDILWVADDGTDFVSEVARIRVITAGTMGANAVGGSMELATAADGAQVVTARLTISNAGLFTFAAGTTPASVATTPGTASAGSITATGGLGGNTTIATTGVGGIGGGFSFTAGAGGTAAVATTSGTGGKGGSWNVTTGAGAVSAVTGAGNGTGGAGGDFNWIAGNGGAVTTSSGTNLGGKGGSHNWTAGNGGNAQDGTDTGGAGGDFLFTPGSGGTGDTAGAVGIMKLAGGFVFQSSSATEIGISVTNALLAVGTSGSLVAPYLSSTGAAFSDAIGGDINGAIGINYDSDTGPTSTLEVRSNGAWVSVAVTGYLMQNRVPWMENSTFLSHPNQVYREDGRVWIDESLCYICGEKMVPGEQITFWANGPTERGVHAIFGHTHLEKNEDFVALDSKLAILEAENIMLRSRLEQLERRELVTVATA